jgi:signal transduction histidine kinase/ActR/RegA family two-component response regulator
MVKDPKSTQVLSKKSLCAEPAHINDVVDLLGSGEDPRNIFNAILDESLLSCKAKGAALLLPSNKDGQTHEVVAKVGIFDSDNFKTTSITEAKIGLAGRLQFAIIYLGAPIGAIIIDTEEELSKEAFQQGRMLAYHAGVCFEKQRNNQTIQTLHDRLEVLNEVNQLIASNASLDRLVKSLVRESAFRFSADVTVVMLVNEEKTLLTPKGSYGCTLNQVPSETPTNQGLLAQVLRVGGQISIQNLNSQPNHGLSFLADLDVQALEISCLEVRGDTLGVLINAYRSESFTSQEDLTRFAEFAQGAAVAIANSFNQERIKHYTTKLEDLVNKRTQDLEIATNKAEEANQAKSRFLANMSHELRTPLTAIVGYSSVLIDGIFGELTEKQSEALQAVCKSSEHLKNLIDDVLNLARIESGKEEAEIAQVSIKECLQHVSKLIQQNAINKGIRVMPVNLAQDLNDAKMLADSKHMNQVLINLLSNAVKYTPSGGQVWIKASTVSDKVKIEVCDTGVGIPTHKKLKLFERFERGEDSYSKSQEGTGIGLNLTKHLVELNGGLIGAESEEGQGSIFWIMMPLATATEASVTLAQTNSPKKKTRLDGLSALVVEDNQDTCEVLRQVLQAAGASVKTAHNVKEGIIALEENIPDIILTDLAMPGETGISLINHIRRGAENIKKLPIIVLSACAFESDKQNAFDAGASAFIAKPFNPSSILTQVRDLTLAGAFNSSKNS